MRNMESTASTAPTASPALTDSVVCRGWCPGLGPSRLSFGAVPALLLPRVAVPQEALSDS
jgi:hypothetical protein